MDEKQEVISQELRKGDVRVLTMTEDESRALSSLYTNVKSDILQKVGVEVEGGHVEIYNVYVNSEEDVGIALYYISGIHENDEPLTEYATSTDARPDTERLGFFNASGEPLHYDVQEAPDKGRYLFCVRLDRPITRGCRIEIYTKAHMGGRIWMEAPHHRRHLKKGEPVVFDGMRSVSKMKYVHATLWKMPTGCRLFEAFPQPWEIYAEDDRLNILFVLHALGVHKMYMKYLNP